MKQTQSGLNNDFKFWLPFDSIEKAKAEEGNPRADENGEVMKIEGLASTNSEDSDGEFLDYNGFQLDEFSFINWNHNKNPEDYIGEPVDWQIKPGQGLWIKGELYPDQRKAVDAWNLGKALTKSKRGNKLGFSIEGSVLQRDPSNPKKILKAKVTAVAVCPHPKNGDTFVDFITKGQTNNEKWEYEEIKDEQTEKGENIDYGYNEDANGGNERYLIDIVDNNGRRIIVDDQYRISIMDKAFSAEAPTQGGITTMEHIDGEKVKEKDKKKWENKKGIKKSKAETFDYIFSKYPNLKIDKAKNLYKLIKNMANKQENEPLTEEEINKAFENIKALANGTSGENTEKGKDSVAYQDQTNIDRKKTEGDSASDGGQVTDLNKAIDTIKNYMKDKYEKSEIFKKMKDEGYDEETVSKAFEKAAAANVEDGAYKSDNDGKDDKVEKSYDDQIKDMEAKLEELKKAKESEKTDNTNNNSDKMEKSQLDELQKSITDSIEKSVNPLKESVTQLADITKAQKEKTDEFQKSIDDIKGRLEQVESQSVGRKSVVSKGYQQQGKEEQIEKGQEGQGQNQKTPVYVNDKTQRNQLSKALNDTVEWDVNGDISKEDEAFLKSLGKFESSGTIEPKVLEKAHEMGYDLIR